MLGDGAAGNAGRRLAGGGPLEHIAGVGKIVLEAPARSAWPGRGEATALCFAGSPAATGRTSVQFFQSRFSISMAMGEPMVLPWRTPLRMCAVSRLDAHAAAAAVALLASPELAVDAGFVDGNAGGQSGNESDEALAV